MKTANLAIVFTDIKGFTERTSRQTLEENERLLETHARLLRPLFEAFGGRIVKSIGDAFLVTFESPTQAVLSGMAIQDRLWLHNRSAPEVERLDVRVAINVGEVRLEGRDVFGEPVNIAARVEGIAEAGEVYFTEAVYLAMNKAEVPAEPVGDFELKGIPGSVKVYRVPRAPHRVQAGEADPRPPAASPPFGNLALARVREESLAPRRLVSSIAEKTARAVSGAQSPNAPMRRYLRVGVVVLVGLGAVALGVSVLFGSELDRAIRDVADAPPAERRKRVDAVEALISRLEDPGDREWYRGRLLEALDRTEEAVSRYRSAASRGQSRAADRLVELLEHDTCAVRSAAARQIGELKLESARGALEDLAEAGGPDDASGGGVIGSIFGCNSKEAASRALKALE